MSEMRIMAYVEKQALGSPDAPVIIVDQCPPITYRQLYDIVCKAQEYLTGIGLGINDRVAVILENGMQMACAFFGAFLHNSGASTFFLDLASSIAGWSKGGLAKVGIITSGLFGMISVSPTANVSTSGVITIPMMNKQVTHPALPRR